MPEQNQFIGTIEHPGPTNTALQKANLFSSFMQVYQKGINQTLDDLVKKLQMTKPEEEGILYKTDTDHTCFNWDELDPQHPSRQLWSLGSVPREFLSKYFLSSMRKELRKPISKREIKFKSKSAHKHSYRPKKRRYHK